MLIHYPLAIGTPQRLSLPKVSALTQALLSTTHEVCPDDNGWRCVRRGLGSRVAATQNGPVAPVVGARVMLRHKLLAQCRVPNLHEPLLGRASPLKGIVLHSTHALLWYKGLYVCERCGRAVGSAVRKLAHPCEGRVLVSGQSLLVRVKNIFLPWGMNSWPCEAAPELPSPHLA